MIFNQGNTGQCKEYALISLIDEMTPGRDLTYMVDAVNENKAGMLTNPVACKFFKARGFIKSYRNVPNLLLKGKLTRHIPLLSGVTGVDWEATNKPPFIAKFIPDRSYTHAVCAVHFDVKTRLIKVKNTYGPKWGDNGYYYIHADDIDKMWVFTQIGL